jgi:NAD-dependent dihydropyrimidine dehydrogenase PreA subunit
MAFAVEGKPMNDPQCVRCSACVNACPTGVLQFGELLPDGTAKLDKLIANPLHATKDGSG